MQKTGLFTDIIFLKYYFSKLVHGYSTTLCVKYRGIVDYNPCLKPMHIVNEEVTCTCTDSGQEQLSP